MAEDDDGNVDGAEHRQLVSLLEQAAFALQEGAVTGQFQPQALRQARLRAAYTERLRSSLMALISIFLRPMV